MENINALLVQNTKGLQLHINLSTLYWQPLYCLVIMKQMVHKTLSGQCYMQDENQQFDLGLVTLKIIGIISSIKSTIVKQIKQRVISIEQTTLMIKINSLNLTFLSHDLKSLLEHILSRGNHCSKLSNYKEIDNPLFQIQ